MQNSNQKAVSLSIIDIVEILWRRKVFVVLGTILGIMLAFLLTLTVDPKYVSRATLLVDLRQLEVAPNKLVPNATSDILDTLVNSERSRLTSNGLLEKVVTENGLQNIPEFRFGDSEAEADRIAGAATILRKSLRVDQKQDTLVLSIAVTTKNAQLSYEINQSLLRNYLADRVSILQNASAKTLSSLREQLAEQVERLTEAENEVEKYKVQNAIVTSRGELSDARQITTVTDQLNSARLEVARIEARYKQIQDAVRSVATASSDGEAGLSTVVSDLRSRQILAQEEYASLKSTLGPSHPRIKSMEVRLGSLRKALDTELAELVKVVEQDLKAAKSVQASLETELKHLETQFGNTNQRLVPLRELELRVDAARSVYTQTLTRMREISAQEGVDSSNVSILSDPTRPLESESVSRKLLLMIGAVVGTSFGVLLAIFTGRLTETSSKGLSISQSTGLPLIAELPALGTKLVRHQNGTLGISLTKLFNRAARNRSFESAFERIYLKLGLDREASIASTKGANIVLVTSVSANETAPVSANLAAKATSEGQRVLLVAPADEAQPFVRYLMHLKRLNLIERTSDYNRGDTGDFIDFQLHEESRPEDLVQLVREIDKRRSTAFKYDLVVIDGQQISGTPLFECYAKLADTILMLVGQQTQSSDGVGPSLDDDLENAYELLDYDRKKVEGFVYLTNVGQKSDRKIYQEVLSMQDLPLVPIDMRYTAKRSENRRHFINKKSTMSLNVQGRQQWGVARRKYAAD